LALCPLVAVLGARWPGTKAWNLIVLSLLVVFSLPLVEQWLLGRLLERGRVGMDLPRFVFYWIVAAVGVMNYVPTRFGLAALAFAAAVAVQTIAVGPWTISAPFVATLSDVAGVFATSAAWLALGLRARSVPTGIDGAWITLRDGWGLVWALRVCDRWNAAAEHHAWPIRLTWSGFQPVVGPTTTSAQFDAAEHQFRLLLRRFADPDELMGSPTNENATPNGARRCEA
jgi:hypothetical protein